MTDEPLAHSARYGAPTQSYRCHVSAVTRVAEENACAVARYLAGNGDAFVAAVRAAAIFHDLGKLDAENQRILNGKTADSLPFRHDDAASAHLLATGNTTAAVLAYGHHHGLASFPGEKARAERVLRTGDEATYERTQASLATYLTEHAKAFGGAPATSAASPPGPWSGIALRMALSCLVDADHGDTARHYGREPEDARPEPRWKERLAALSAFVRGLGEKDGPRNDLRRRIYEACRDASVDPPIRACDSPVGSGKTTAVMAHLLKVAAEKNLRHVFVVLPYTNIISQSVDVYRRALVLPGEKPEEIVAEHHHRADFEGVGERHLATLWRAPIVVTTAVQFFETLASSETARLRKLHELAGSAVFVDEAHAAIPSFLWPQTWRWLTELADRWGCRFVLASGSLARFWQLREFRALADNGKSVERAVCDLVPEAIRAEAQNAERRRITYRAHDPALRLGDLVSFVRNRLGPRLVVLNTVQSAAVVARRMRKEGLDVLHISTALAPADRDPVIETVRRRLRDESDFDWTLVATSCVEAGMDFSFRTAMRESSTTASLIQIGGRANRHGRPEAAEVWDFRVLPERDADDGAPLTLHRALDPTRAVLAELFAEGRIDALGAAEVATEAIRRELGRQRVIGKAAAALTKGEEARDFPEVSNLYQVIDSDARLVVVDASVIERLERRDRVMPRDLVMHSVQLRPKRIDDLKLPLIGDHADLYRLPAGLAYDSGFLGIMAGILEVTDRRGSAEDWVV